MASIESQYTTLYEVIMPYRDISPHTFIFAHNANKTQWIN